MVRLNLCKDLGTTVNLRAIPVCDWVGKHRYAYLTISEQLYAFIKDIDGKTGRDAIIILSRITKCTEHDTVRDTCYKLIRISFCYPSAVWFCY